MNYTTLTRGGWPSAATSALVFALPFLSLLAPWGVSACSFLFLLGALACRRRALAAWRRHAPVLRPVLLAFLLHFLFALACWALRPEARLNTLERPARMLFASTALFLVLAWRPPATALWVGAASGAFGAFVLIAWQAFGL